MTLKDEAILGPLLLTQINFNPSLDKLLHPRDVMIHRYIDISYRECQRYAYRIVGACIDTDDISSSGRNQAIKCP